MIDYRTSDRVRVKGTTIFGSCLGFTKEGLVVFLDEETNEINKYDPFQAEKSYDKWG